MTGIDHKPAATPARPEAITPAALAGGVGAMAVCCTLTLLIAAGVIGTLSGAAIGGIALGGGIALAFLVWLTIILIRRHTARAVDCCPPGQAASHDGRTTQLGDPR